MYTINVQPLTDLLATLPAVLKVVVLLATIWLCGGITETALRLHQQGYLKAGPTAAIVLSGAVAGYALGGPVISVVTALCYMSALFITSGIRRAVRRSLQLRKRIAQLQANRMH
ncbi:Uncharacterised protein [Burkholderia pseudomallei]|nr:Uncharacterised protein [Burkholderia pseudomallei]